LIIEREEIIIDRNPAVQAGFFYETKPKRVIREICKGFYSQTTLDMVVI
jgi:hypothetical protein